MALPPYFDKAALSAASLLANFSPNGFKQTLEDTVVAIELGDGPSSFEARVASELTVNLLSRLYPRLVIRCHARDESHAADLCRLATQINPNVTLETENTKATLSLGFGPVKDDPDLVSIGSDGWIARVSSRSAFGFSKSQNPFGAAAAACIGVANVFRATFAGQLTRPQLDADIALSTLDLTPATSMSRNPAIGDTEITATSLVGIGAIGNATIWTLARAGVTGELHVFDPEAVELHNGQRYVLVTPLDRQKSKVSLAVAALSQSGLTAIPHADRWNATDSEFARELVAAAVDSAQARREIQAALPKRVVNAWTQPLDVGLSWHQFLEGPCVCCLYMPEEKSRNEDQIIAEAIGLEGQEMLVRVLLRNNTPVGTDLIKQISAAKGVPVDDLLAFQDRPLRTFYQEVVCGGALLANTGSVPVDVPANFQSAFAGALLGASIVSHAAGLGLPSSCKAVFNLLAPLGSEFLVPLAKHSSGRCICQDADFRNAYERLNR